MRRGRVFRIPECGWRQTGTVLHCSAQMAEPRQGSFAAAYAEFNRLRWVYWLCLVGGIMWSLLVTVVGLILGLKPNTPQMMIAIIAGVSVFLPCWAIGFVTQFMVRRWRCPQCGQPFASRSGLTGSICRNCGLDLYLAAKREAEGIAD